MRKKNVKTKIIPRITTKKFFRVILFNYYSSKQPMYSCLHSSDALNAPNAQK